MADHENKDVNIEDNENNLGMEHTEYQSLDMDPDKKNLSFSFDKLLSSLNMNRRKRDDLIPNDDEFEEELELLQIDEELVYDEEVAESADEKSVESDEKEAFKEEELKVFEEETPDLESEEAAEDLNTPQPEEKEDMVEEKACPEEPEPGTETELSAESLDNQPVINEETPENTSYEDYQNGEGGIDYDKLVGETKLMTIDSIYSCKHLPKNLNESVFMIELYAKTLPENLPIEVKRQSVLNILKVGSLDVDDLLQDAYNRIDLLNEVLEDVAQKTEEMNETNIAEIAELNQKIAELNQTMAKRAKYQQKQNTSIGYEIQRIINIVEFINPR